jgi:hypothetical protein
MYAAEQEADKRLLMELSRGEISTVSDALAVPLTLAMLGFGGGLQLKDIAELRRDLSTCEAVRRKLDQVLRTIPADLGSLNDEQRKSYVNDHLSGEIASMAREARALTGELPQRFAGALVTIGFPALAGAALGGPLAGAAGAANGILARWRSSRSTPEERATLWIARNLTDRSDQ